MRFLVLILSLVHMEIQGELTGVELVISPGELDTGNSLYTISQMGDTVYVNFGTFINPLYFASRVKIYVFYPESSSVDLDLTLSFSSLVGDFTQGSLKECILDLRMSGAKLVLSSQSRSSIRAYSFLSNLTIVGAEGLKDVARFNLDGGKLGLYYLAPGGETVDINAHGARINISPYDHLDFESRGFLNIRAGGRYNYPEGFPSIRLFGNFNIIKIE